MKCLWISVLVALIGLPNAALATSAGGLGSLGEGMRNVREGDFETALVTLDAAARELEKESAPPATLAQAYLYLGITYLHLGQRALASAKMKQAVSLDNALRLDPQEFPPKILNAFEAARNEVLTESSLEQESKRGRGKTPWILLGGGAAAAGGIGVFLTRSKEEERENTAPTAAFSVSPEGTALADATLMTFTATASDAEGDTLMFTWSFGDGSAGSGATTTHTFARTGSLVVTLTVSDGLKSTSVSQTVTVGHLSGSWLAGPTVLLGETRLDVAQSGTGVSVTPYYGANRGGLGTANPGVFNPRRTRLVYHEFTTGSVWHCTMTIDGTADAALRTISGTATCGGAASCPCLGQTRPVRLVRR